MSHLGRPKAGPEARFSLKPAAVRLSELLNRPVDFVDDCIGPVVEQKVAALGQGEILMLENLRFYAEEKKNDAAFARKLADLCDVYVNNAFSVSHREHASVFGVPGFAKVSAAGFLLEKALFLGKI